MSLTDKSNFYDNLLSKYALTDQQQYDNKYPRWSASALHGIVEIKDFKPQQNNMAGRKCSRCGTQFMTDYNSKCDYYPGRLVCRQGTKKKFYCCEGKARARGCQTHRFHVTKDNFDSLAGFVSTISASNLVQAAAGDVHTILAVDCEMCYTTGGFELTRVSLVDADSHVVLDEFVKPRYKVTDYITKYSGVTESHLQHVTTTLKDTQKLILTLINKDTVLIGHSLENDLIALKMIHGNVVDTSVVFPHDTNPSLKRGLRSLANDFLQKSIQTEGSTGHSPIEDARTCMQLMRWKHEKNKSEV